MHETKCISPIDDRYKQTDSKLEYEQRGEELHKQVLLDVVKLPYNHKYLSIHTVEPLPFNISDAVMKLYPERISFYYKTEDIVIRYK